MRTKYFVIWSTMQSAWLTASPSKVTTFRHEAHEFPEGDLRLLNARKSPEAFQIYPVRPLE